MEKEIVFIDGSELQLAYWVKAIVEEMNISIRGFLRLMGGF
ncbi:MAG: hypothetical protein ACJA2N_000600 [Salibacteraceae bacterium]|jgi:hypothetical protein